MLSIPPSAKVFLCLEKVDFRKHINGLKKWAQYELQLNPFSGAYFFFLSKNKKAMKIIYFDGQGMCLHWKVLSRGSFKWWEKIHDASCKYLAVHPTEGQVMLMNGTSRHLKIQQNWREFG